MLYTSPPYQIPYSVQHQRAQEKYKNIYKLNNNEISLSNYHSYQSAGGEGV